MDGTTLLQRTLELARRGAGHVAPNPEVGAVIVADGVIIAEGHHHVYGGLHAEADALRKAGDRARGATLYCNLEPCSFHKPGKHQPACTGRIIEAGVARVVVGQLDPNPNVRGAGIRSLRAAGIEVALSADAERFWRHNRIFNTRMALGRPYVHLKFAASLDGRIATRTGESRWITSSAARDDGHRLRASCDAVAVGIGTVLADDPRLTVRCGDRGESDARQRYDTVGARPVAGSPTGEPLVAGGPPRQPRAVVFDSRLRTPLESALVRERPGEVTILAAEPTKGEAPGFSTRRRALEAAGVRVVVPPGPRVDPGEALAALAREGIGSVLVEGGPRLITSFLASRLWDGITAYVAPLIIGDGRNAVGDLAVTRLDEALQLEGICWRSAGSDAVLEGMRKGWLEEVMSTVPAEFDLKEERDVYRAG